MTGQTPSGTGANRPFLAPLFDLHPKHQLVNSRNGRIVASHLSTAFDSASRRTGLLRHTSMPEGSALVIAPTNAIHTFFMRFAIDVAFVRKDGRVIKTWDGLRPWRIAVALGAFAVIELPAGALKLSDTRPEDILVVSSA